MTNQSDFKCSAKSLQSFCVFKKGDDVLKKQKAQTIIDLNETEAEKLVLALTQAQKNVVCCNTGIAQEQLGTKNVSLQSKWW